MAPPLVVLLTLCLLGLTLRFPRAACVLSILALETSPDSWLSPLTGGHEMIIGILKAFGLVLVAVLWLRTGARWDRYNPSLAFTVMFLAGLMHGLHPGLTLLSSLRSLIGSAAPFLFGFVRLPENFGQAVRRATICGPLFTIAFGSLLAITGLAPLYVLEQGALRLGGSGEPPFLAGFALIAVYAGLIEHARRPNHLEAGLIALNLLIILLTGARLPLALAVLLIFSLLILQRRLMALAACGAAAALSVMFLNNLTFLRIIDLAQLGEAANLSHRDLVWPYFQAAITASPFFGWGIGAGKIIIPVTSQLTTLIGTNAAHDEYLRIGSEGGIFGLVLLVTCIFLWVMRGTCPLPRDQRWLIRLIFLGFMAHSATDNTLIATTSSIFFIWVSTVFATAPEAAKRAT